MPSVWMPPGGLRPPKIDWGRHDRYTIGNNHGKGDHASARKFVDNCTLKSASRSTSHENLNKLNEHSGNIPAEVEKFLRLWFTIEETDVLWNPVRRLLHACSLEDSLCGIVTLNMVPSLEQLLSIVNSKAPFATDVNRQLWRSAILSMKNEGMGPEIGLILESAKNSLIFTMIDDLKTVSGMSEYSMMCILIEKGINHLFLFLVYPISFGFLEMQITSSHLFDLYLWIDNLLLLVRIKIWC
jgi:hypothetical protein